MNPNELKTYTFIDGDFSMDINVSIEEHNIYMKQTEIAKLLDVNQSTISRKLKNYDSSKWDSYAETQHFCIDVMQKAVNYYGLEIIKEIGQKYNPGRIQKLEEWLEQIIIENSQEVIDYNFKIVRYNQDNLDIPVRFENDGETLWMTAKEMAILFDTTEKNIYYHMENIFEDKELSDYSIFKESLTMGQTGQKYKVALYNLDMIKHIIYNRKEHANANNRKIL